MIECPWQNKLTEQQKIHQTTIHNLGPVKKADYILKD